MKSLTTTALLLFYAALPMNGVAQTTAASAIRDHSIIPAGLATLQNYKSARVSSEDRPGNADMRQIGPGETLTLADIKGAGEISHIWTTINTPDRDHLHNIVFRIYWDGNDFPSVESPVGDFFGLGLGRYYIFSNPVQAIGTDRGMNSFWPMPFSKGARITATNESQTTVGAYYYYVDYKKYDKAPENMAYFHAQYLQATPNTDGKPYLIMETDGGRGHFAGVNLSIHTQSSGWWGEGDDIFTIDGEQTPSMWGTGSEDYFCGAWCYGETFYNDYFGMPLRERIDQGSNNFWNVYRHHLEAPVTFTKSIKVEIEHGDNGVSNTRNPRNNNYYSCAYWYVDNPRPLKGKLAPAKERIPSFEQMPVEAGVFELQYLKANAPAHLRVESQQIQREADRDGDWLYNDQMFVRDGREGDVVSLTFSTTETLSGDAAAFVTRAPDYGVIEVSIDGKSVSFDGYNEQIDRMRVPLGQLDLESGDHTLAVKIKGKNPQSKGIFWGIDYIKIGSELNETEKAAKELKPVP